MGILFSRKFMHVLSSAENGHAPVPAFPNLFNDAPRARTNAAPDAADDDDDDDEGSVTPVNSRSGSTASDESAAQGGYNFQGDQDQVYDDVFTSDPVPSWSEQQERPRQLSPQQAKKVAPSPPADDTPQADYEPYYPKAEDKVDAASSATPPLAAEYANPRDVITAAEYANPSDPQAENANQPAEYAALTSEYANQLEPPADYAIYDELDDLVPKREGSKKPEGPKRLSKVQDDSDMKDPIQITRDFNEHLVSNICSFTRLN